MTGVQQRAAWLIGVARKASLSASAGGGQEGNLDRPSTSRMSSTLCHWWLAHQCRLLTRLRGLARLPRGKPARGFTLVEVLAAMTLGLAVIAASYAALSSSIAGARRIDGFVEESATLSSLSDYMKRQLANVYYNSASELAPVFTVTAADASTSTQTVTVPRGSLTFSFAALSTSAADAPAFPYYTVTWFVADASANSPGGFSRRITPLWPRDVTEEPTDELIAPEVRGFEVACFDGTQWLYEWDAASSGLPVAVRVDLHVEPERFEADPWSTVPTGATGQLRLRIHRIVSRLSWVPATSASGIETTVSAGEGQNVQTGR